MAEIYADADEYLLCVRYVNCNHYNKVSLCCDYRMVFLHVCDTVTPDIHTCIFAGDDNFSVQKNFFNQHSLRQTTVQR